MIETTPTNVVLSLPSLITIVLATLGAFTATFWALQRYVGNKVDQGLERFETHAGNLELKLDKVVAGLSDLKAAFTGERARLDGIEGRIGRLERRLDSVEQNRHR